MTRTNWRWETTFNGPVCGVDEVGRGPWAGPVITAACVLPSHSRLIGELNDSKKLSPARRDYLAEALLELQAKGKCWFAYGEADVGEIDQLNILHASMLAMRRAVERLLPQCPEPLLHALIDGNRVPPELPLPATAIVRGDALSASIGAASILAKVKRDRLMKQLAEEFPHYGWERNAGYGTAAHQQGLAQFGVTVHHRRSFRPIREAMARQRGAA